MSLETFTNTGASLLNKPFEQSSQAELQTWNDEVAKWLNEQYPDSGFAADWLTAGSIHFAQIQVLSVPRMKQAAFIQIINSKLRWLGNLPMKAQMLKLSIPEVTQVAAIEIGRKEITLNAITSRAYVDPGRIAELKECKSKYDLTRVIRLCEEINICYANECYISVTVLIRALIDHIPPLFDKATFTEVANNYGQKSFKELMLPLDNFCRKVADGYLHGHIREAEALPNPTQIEFSSPLDYLLQEIVRMCKG